MAVLHSEESSFVLIIFSLEISFLGELMPEAFKISEPFEEFLIIFADPSITRDALRVVLERGTIALLRDFIRICLALFANGDNDRFA